MSAWFARCEPGFACSTTWLAANAGRLPFALHATAVCDGVPSHCAVVGFPDALTLHGRNLTVSVDVMWQSVLVDNMLNITLSPVRYQGGCRCMECKTGNQKVFASPDARLVDHLFEPLLRWMRSWLAPTPILGLRIDDGFSAARLFRDKTAWRRDFGRSGFAIPNPVQAAT